MRVKKICAGKCGKLKNMYDFLPSEEYADKKTTECKSCIEDEMYSENNSKIENNNNFKTKEMATLAEKRAAAKAAEAGTTTTAAPSAPKPKAESTPKEAAPKPETPKAPKPKVGDTTKDGLKVVGEAKAPGQRGRKATEDKPIEQLDMEGNPTGVKFATLQEAADSVGKSKAYLLDGLKGWAKSVGGFKWRYEGEELFIREKKTTPTEKAFIAKGTATDIPVPGDLDYDADLHAPKAEVEEEEVLDGEELLETTEE